MLPSLEDAPFLGLTPDRTQATTEPGWRWNGYTLVLDLDETLVHYYEEGGSGYYDKRPGAEEFL